MQIIHAKYYTNTRQKKKTTKHFEVQFQHSLKGFLYTFTYSNQLIILGLSACI